MSQPILVMCLLFNIYLCRAEPVGMGYNDTSPIGCAINGLIFSMQLDMSQSVFKDSEGLVWKARGIRCIQTEPTAIDLAARVKAKIHP